MFWESANPGFWWNASHNLINYKFIFHSYDSLKFNYLRFKRILEFLFHIYKKKKTNSPTITKKQWFSFSVFIIINILFCIDMPSLMFSGCHRIQAAGTHFFLGNKWNRFNID